MDARAYAPLAHSIAARGVTVVVPTCPNSICFGSREDSRRMALAMSSHADVQTWVLSGHSLGGRAAVQFLASLQVVDPDPLVASLHVGNNSDATFSISGLFMVASYPGVDVSAMKIPCLSVTGGLDGVLNWTNFENSKALLPKARQFVSIPAGNHGGFGDYIDGPGYIGMDNNATINASAQQQRTVDALWVHLIDQISCSKDGHGFADTKNTTNKGSVPTLSCCLQAVLLFFHLMVVGSHC